MARFNITVSVEVDTDDPEETVEELRTTYPVVSKEVLMLEVAEGLCVCDPKIENVTIASEG